MMELEEKYVYARKWVDAVLKGNWKEADRISEEFDRKIEREEKES